MVGVGMLGTYDSVCSFTSGILYSTWYSFLRTIKAYGTEVGVFIQYRVSRIKYQFLNESSDINENNDTNGNNVLQ
jgi:hypothetical protein